MSGQGWTTAVELQTGDLLRTQEGEDVPVEVITDSGQEAILCRMSASVRLFPHFGFWPADTPVQTADGPKPIEDMQPGDRIVADASLGSEWQYHRG